MEKRIVKERLLVYDTLRPHHLFCSRLMLREPRKTRWEKVRGETDDVLTSVSFILLHCPLFPPYLSPFFFMYFSERWQDRASRQAPVKFNMILKNGEIKAERPCSLTYVKFIQTCLALLLNLIVHGFLNDVQIKRTLSKTQ